MPIRKEPSGLSQLYGQAAVLAGRAAATREAVERGERAAERTMRQYDRGQQVQLALKRMANNNEMIQFREEMDLQTRKEAQLFQLETIKTRANLDFAREEKDRQELQDEIKQGIKAIREYPYLSDTEREKAIYDFTMKKQHDYTMPTERKPRGVTEPTLARGVKFLQQYEEPAWYQPFAKEPTEEETLMKEYYERLIRKETAPPTAADVVGKSYQVPAKVSPGMYQLNQIIERGGQKYRVVGFDTDGMPMVNPVR